MAMEYGSPAGTLDLHMHSVYSDGSETVEGLIAAAQGMRLAGIAVTDHDCLRQLSSIRAAARSCRCGRRGPLCAPVRRLTVASYR